MILVLERRLHIMRNVVLAAIVAFAVFGPIPGHAQGMTTAQPSEEQRVLAVEDE